MSDDTILNTLQNLLQTTQKGIERAYEMLEENLADSGYSEDDIKNRPEMLELASLLVPLEDAIMGRDSFKQPDTNDDSTNE